MNRLILPVLLCLSVLNSAWAAKPLSPVALFGRCYAHLTQKRLSRSHPLYASVVAGNLSPIDACLQILDASKLTSTGADEGKLINNNAESRAVIRAMNDHHRNWFPNDDIVISSPQCGERCPFSDNLHDGAEAALHVTRTLLTEGAKLSEILTGISAMEALRSGGPRENKAQPANKIFEGNSVSTGFDAAPVQLDIELPQLGELLGVRKLALNPRKQLLVRTNFSSNQSKEFELHHSAGGGILGTSSYLLLNLGRPDVQPSSGGLVMSRRWSKSVLQDFLCRDLPVIRISDAVPFVNAHPGKDTPPFRGSRNCMQCHATMDPMAATARNVGYSYIPGWTASATEIFRVSSQIYHYDVSLPSETAEVDVDSEFYRRPPKGRLFYRDYQGTLVDRPLMGISGLGQALAESDDFYVCTASRYFNYFTGIRVNLDDPGAEGAVTPSEEEKKYRERVIQLGLELKGHQSLRELVSSILRSDLYRSPSFEPTVAARNL